MTLHSYLLFVGASIVLVIVPGPDMLYLLGRSIAQGRKAGYMAALGFSVGGCCHLLAAILGLSAILATSALAFSMVKWLGAAYLVYLVYLGFRTLWGVNAAVTLPSQDTDQRKMRTVFWQAFLSDVLNPKVAVFFIALLPQFVDWHNTNRTAQLLLLGLTLNMIAIPFNLLIVLLAAKLTTALRESTTLNALLHKLLGAMFVLLGLKLVIDRS